MPDRFASDYVKYTVKNSGSGLTFNEGVSGNFTKHAFTGGRHADLGLSVETMSSKGLNLVEQNMSLLKAGDNIRSCGYALKASNR